MTQLKKPPTLNLVPRTVNLPSPEEDAIDIQKSLLLLWRRKWALLSSILTGLCIGALYLHFLAPRYYAATTSIMLDDRSSQVTDIADVIGGITGSTSSLNTQTEVLQSRILLGQIINKLSLNRDPEFNPKLSDAFALHILISDIGKLLLPSDISLSASTLTTMEADRVIDRLKQDIKIHHVPQSMVYEITATTNDPRKSAVIADTLAQTYIDNQLSLKNNMLRKSENWLSQRSAALANSLQEAEAKLNQFNLDAELISPERLDAMELQMKRSRTRIDELKEEIKQSQADLIELQKTDHGPSKETDRLSDTIARLNMQLIAETDLEKTLNQQTKQQRDEQINLAQLSLKAQALRSLNEYFVKRMAEVSSMAGMQTSDSRIISNATIDLKPAKPAPFLVLLITGLLGAVAAGVVIFWMESRSFTFRTAEALENFTGKTVIGQIPMVPSKSRNDILDYLSQKPTSAAAEAVRNLRTSVLLSDTKHPPQIIGTTSSLPGEGKTTTAFSLAQNFADMGQKVLLVEGDIRRRIFGEYMPVNSDRGLVAVMNGRHTMQEAVTRDDRIGADILTADVTSTSAADLFSSPKFSRLLQQARSSYDTIIIDTAPVLLVPDSRIIAQHVDAMLFIVAWDSTSQEQVLAALRMFETIGTDITGIVLNQINPKGMKRYGYSGRYGAYADYGSKYYTN